MRVGSCALEHEENSLHCGGDADEEVEVAHCDLVKFAVYNDTKGHSARGEEHIVYGDDLSATKLRHGDVEVTWVRME